MKTSTQGRLMRGSIPVQYGVWLCCFPKPGCGTHWMLVDEKNLWGGAPGGRPTI